MFATRALFVPAEAMPSAKMAFCATSGSVSCDNRLSMSTIPTLGCETHSSATASGIALRTHGSPYCSRCSNDRSSISPPMSSDIPTSERPSTARGWCAGNASLSFGLSSSSLSRPSAAGASSGCSPQSVSSFWIISTLPLPAYAHTSSTVVTYDASVGCSIVLRISIVASYLLPQLRNRRPRPRLRRCSIGSCASSFAFVSDGVVAGVAVLLLFPSPFAPSAAIAVSSSAAAASTIVADFAISAEMIACVHSSSHVDTNTMPSARAAYACTSSGSSAPVPSSASPSPEMMGARRLETSSLRHPAYAMPRPSIAAVRT
mmetsp:Transcript_2317/g.5243  ORF Transcript_2317/g.5243 Transcript_2317/m.5243 type:complete len:317 (+) Transcript_2317:656-1606(+)